MRLIQMLREEGNSGQTHDVCSEHCLAGCLTKGSAKADELIKSVMTGILPFMCFHLPGGEHVI